MMRQCRQQVEENSSIYSLSAVWIGIPQKESGILGDFMVRGEWSECNNDSDCVKRCTVMEMEGIRQMGWRRGGMDDKEGFKSLGLSWEDA